MLLDTQIFPKIFIGQHGALWADLKMAADFVLHNIIYLIFIRILSESVNIQVSTSFSAKKSRIMAIIVEIKGSWVVVKGAIDMHLGGRDI